LGFLGDLGRGPVALDTAIFISFIEEESRFLPLIDPLFEEADRGKRQLVSSALTLLEVLVVPYRSRDGALANRYKTLLTKSRGVRLVEISLDQLDAAAQIRAATGVKTPDALQLAAALTMGCKVFVTNDRRIPSIRDLRVVQLAAYAR
jgi:predicted nucleic acid-binding protein